MIALLSLLLKVYQYFCILYPTIDKNNMQHSPLQFPITFLPTSYIVNQTEHSKTSALSPAPSLECAVDSNKSMVREGTYFSSDTVPCFRVAMTGLSHCLPFHIEIQYFSAFSTMGLS